ncbi:MAG: DUF4296 domain-containing protein [Bacteroidales bacterium]|nr:DUF4296 domain-containing protein [Bacteroidales bacterium]
MRALRGILFFAGLCAVLSACGRGRVLSMDDFGEVYRDMLLADQWMAMHPEDRAEADSTFFYGPVFGRHGISAKDFDASLSYYISEPDKFIKILERVGKSLEGSRKELLRRKAESAELQAEADSIERLSLVPRYLDTLLVRYHIVNATMLDTVVCSTARPESGKFVDFRKFRTKG